MFWSLNYRRSMYINAVFVRFRLFPRNDGHQHMYTYWLINVNKTDFHRNLLILGLFTCAPNIMFAGRRGTSVQYRYFTVI